jgi:lipoate-protein ligase B
MDVIDLGRLGYAAAHAYQLDRLGARIREEANDAVLLVEHDPVFTVGRKRDAELDLLSPGDVPVIDVERGGGVTFHGPGQVVAYPIVALAGVERDLHRFMHRLEQVMIETCATFGLRAERDPRNTGAWCNGRKLGSVGIACRRWVTWHGMSLNVDVDPAYFERVNSCGMQSSTMTTMAIEAGRAIAVADVRAEVAKRFSEW